MRPLTSLLLPAALALAGCGGGPTYEVGGTSQAAGTDAVITADEIDGGNVEVTVDILHLPPPGRMGRGLTTYVVWFTAPEAPAQKAGVLDYDADDRRGRLRATTPERRFELRVTAERNRNVRSPSETVAVRQTVNVDED